MLALSDNVLSCILVDCSEAMLSSGIGLVAKHLVTTVVYMLVRLVFVIVQRIYWQLNGTARKRREARLPENYERSAQVLDVIFFHKFGFLVTVDNFLFTHNRFENPQYIIDNDNVTLMTINEHDAIFCEPQEKGSLRLSVYISVLVKMSDSSSSSSSSSSSRVFV